MPFTSATPTKTRILISGMPNTGKTTSLATFIYGPYDYFDDNEQTDAITYADDKHMVILTCPGEKGIKSLINTPNITSYHYECDEDVNSTTWSTHSIIEFNKITTEVIAQKPDILVVDGFHALYDHIMNRTSKGLYLSGQELSTTSNPYESARMYSQSHNAFGQYITGLYHTHIPLIVATTWEDWEAGNTELEAGKTQSIQAQRYLWPALPGKMAKSIVGQFDIRISARLEKRCLHTDCLDSKQSTLHHVWQFLPKNDVMGVGIKGLRKINKAMKEKPWIHQNYHDLQQLMELCK